MDMWHERTQWNVGQGGFHTAVVLSDDDAMRPIFRYVYDCGSNSAGHAKYAISDYVKSLGPTKHIDAVFLSHFDADHVNGLPALLGASGVTVGRVFLPLLTPLERVIAIARSGEEATEFVVKLAANPAAAIRSLSNAEVVQVSSGSGVSDAVDGTILAFLAEAPDGVNATVFGDPSMWLTQSTGGVLMTDEAIVQVKSGPRSANWVLSFYVESESLDCAEAYLGALAALLEQDLETLRATIEEGDLGSLLTDKDFCDAVRYAYKKVHFDRNRGSMMMLSGPESSGLEESIFLGETKYETQGATWLMTGDGKLNRRASVKKLADHLGSRVSQTQVIALPHHGEEGSFHTALLEVGSRPQLVFASAGLSHRWLGHPDAMVIKSVTSAGLIPWVVTESPASLLFARAWLNERHR